MTVGNDFIQKYNQLFDAIEKAKPGNEALKLLNELRSKFDLVIPGYRNSLTILGDTTYEDRKHFLLELIQNADDAVYKEGNPSISFTIYNDSLEISYNEEGFTTNDVIGITDTGASTKKADKLSSNSFIGEKGIGFKSVFALAKEVHIESGPWHFKLLKENYIVPELTHPTVQRFTEGTKLRIYFSDPKSVTIVANELEKLVTRQLESFLFLQKLKTFHYSDHRNGLKKNYQLCIEENDEADVLKVEATSTSGNTHRTYALYDEEIEFPGRLVGLRWERLGSKHSLKRKMAVVALAQSSNYYDGSGRLFCYLPTEIKLPIPVFLQLDGHLKADRERLHDLSNNSWNIYLLERVPVFLKNAILYWREDDEIKNRLPDFIPDHPGEDQLKHVFERLIENCREIPWVKTFEGWTTPKQAIMADAIWYKWFTEYPNLRLQVEKVLGKKFVAPEWVGNSKWKPKWKTYDITNFSAMQLVEILQLVSLPDGLLLKNENITLLYKVLKEAHEKQSYYQRDSFSDGLYYAKIFPLEGGGFGPLKTRNNNLEKVYWMTGRTKRTSGLEGIIDVKIINPEYTFTYQVGTDSTTERKQEANEINRRNERIRDVLRFMDVPEFNDDRLLSELQIPYLLKREEKWTKEELKTRYRILRSIFDVYKGKRNYDESYLNQLARLSDAYVQGSNGKVKKIHKTILPENTRKSKEDHLYASSGLDTLRLPDSWLKFDLSGENREEKLGDYLIQLRNFLVDCGIANGPRFSFSERKYSTNYDFNHNEPMLYQNWVKKNKRDYTGGNAVALKEVTLDSATLLLIKKGKSSIQIAEGLYKAWKKQFSMNLDSENSFYYRYDPPPGYVRTSYLRQTSKKLIIPDLNWAGLDSIYVPLTTIDGRLTNPNKAFFIKNVRGLNEIFKFIDLVYENEHSGYHPFYLSSLSVKPLTIEMVNQLWREVAEVSYEDLIKAIYELSIIEFDLSELVIYDKVSESFRPIRQFKLGKSVSPTTPYLELQYGHYGKLLGEKLNLSIESEVTPLLDILDKFFSDKQDNEWLQTNFTRLFQQSSNLLVKDKGKIIQRITDLRKKHSVDHDIIVVFNNQSLYEMLLQSNHFIIHIQCDSVSMIQFKQAAKDLGFSLLDDIGMISAAHPDRLDESDGKLLEQMFEKYNEELEAEESARLLAILAEIGGFKNLNTAILRTKELTRVVYGVPISILLPYYDHTKVHYYVSLNDSLSEIAARLLSTFGFNTYKSAYRDFKSFYEELVRMAPVPNKKIVDNVINSLNDKNVTEEFEIAELSEHRIPHDREFQNGEDSQNLFENSIRAKSVSKHYAAITADSWPKSEKGEAQINFPEVSIDEVLEQISNGLIKESEIIDLSSPPSWITAIDPEEEEQIRTSIGNNIEKALKEGPEQREVKERTKKEKPKVNILDRSAQEPKEFLQHQYQGHCQICSTQLKLPNGRSYFEVYRIRENNGEAWWSNNPYNILSLCPNCHALAKHGGETNFSSILAEAELIIRQETFAQEVEAYHGDFYQIDIVHNGQHKQMVISPMHIAYFTALLEKVRNAETVVK
ncbi:hypothetical protein CN481_15590 [Bacillus sp. AFS006103]|nr:hypothetical protein CN481_15590 [Bacillus sp. AFS006103]